MRALTLMALVLPLIARAGLYPPQVRILSHDIHTVCATSEGITQCWSGGGGAGEDIPLPPLKNPISISLSYQNNCAIDDQGLQCWAIDQDGNIRQMPVPSLASPKKVLTEREVSCALDGSEIKCWGKGTQNPKWKMPQLRNARDLIGDENGHFCAVEGDTPVCWGYEPLPRLPEGLNRPVAWSSAFDKFCGIEQSGKIICDYGGYNWMPLPDISVAKLIGTGWQHACASDGTTVKCWGNTSLLLQPPPAARKVKSLLAGWGYTCINDVDGVYCWAAWPNGSNMRPDSVPKIFRRRILPSFHLYQLGDLLGWLASETTPARSKFFSPLADFARKSLTTDERSEEISLTRYLLLKLAAPALLTNDAPRFVSEILPAYRESVADIEAELGFSSIDRIEGSTLNREAALRVIQVALAVQVEFLNFNDRVQWQALQRLAGQALANPADTAATRALLQAVEGAAEVMRKLEANSKSAFLVQAIRISADWLKGQK